MFTPEAIFTYSQYSGIATIAIAVLMVIGLILKWSFRFRLVGVTGFFIVLTIGLFGLGLGFTPRVSYPGAVRYALIYDNGNSQAVVAVPKRKLTAAQTDATLRQAASDLYSYGRGGEANGTVHVRLRTIVHPQAGISEPLYLGEAVRDLTSPNQAQLQITINSRNLAKL